VYISNRELRVESGDVSSCPCCLPFERWSVMLDAVQLHKQLTMEQRVKHVAQNSVFLNQICAVACWEMVCGAWCFLLTQPGETSLPIRPILPIQWRIALCPTPVRARQNIKRFCTDIQYRLLFWSPINL